MQAVDEAVRLVKVTPQLGLLTAIRYRPSDRGANPA
ncbi:hypothetical protein BH09ACT8_BH09ACT8_07570 [soil metagenome]